MRRNAFTLALVGLLLLFIVVTADEDSDTGGSAVTSPPTKMKASTKKASTPPTPTTEVFPPPTKAPVTKVKLEADEEPENTPSPSPMITVAATPIVAVTSQEPAAVVEPTTTAAPRVEQPPSTKAAERSTKAAESDRSAQETESSKPTKPKLEAEEGSDIETQKPQRKSTTSEDSSDKAKPTSESGQDIPKPPPVVTRNTPTESDSADGPAIAPAGKVEQTPITPAPPAKDEDETPPVARPSPPVEDEEPRTQATPVSEPKHDVATPVDDATYRFVEAPMSREMKIFQGIMYGSVFSVVTTLAYRGLDAAGLDQEFFLKHLEGTSKCVIFTRALIKTISFVSWLVATVVLFLFGLLTGRCRSKDRVPVPPPPTTVAAPPSSTSAAANLSKSKKAPLVTSKSLATQKPTATASTSGGWNDNWSDDELESGRKH